MKILFRVLIGLIFFLPITTFAQFNFNTNSIGGRDDCFNVCEFCHAIRQLYGDSVMKKFVEMQMTPLKTDNHILLYVACDLYGTVKCIDTDIKRVEGLYDISREQARDFAKARMASWGIDFDELNAYIVKNEYVMTNTNFSFDHEIRDHWKSTLPQFIIDNSTYLYRPFSSILIRFKGYMVVHQWSNPDVSGAIMSSSPFAEFWLNKFCRINLKQSIIYDKAKLHSSELYNELLIYKAWHNLVGEYALNKFCSIFKDKVCLKASVTLDRDGKLIDMQLSNYLSVINSNEDPSNMPKLTYHKVVFATMEDKFKNYFKNHPVKFKGTDPNKKRTTIAITFPRVAKELVIEYNDTDDISNWDREYNRLCSCLYCLDEGLL